MESALEQLEKMLMEQQALTEQEQEMYDSMVDVAAKVEYLNKELEKMVSKGRLQEGADADIVVFDPATVIDRSTYMDAMIPSAGIPWVLVAGQVVVDRGELTSARPGRAIRAPVNQ